MEFTRIYEFTNLHVRIYVATRVLEYYEYCLSIVCRLKVVVCWSLLAYQYR